MNRRLQVQKDWVMSLYSGVVCTSVRKPQRIDHHPDVQHSPFPPYKRTTCRTIRSWGVDSHIPFGGSRVLGGPFTSRTVQRSTMCFSQKTRGGVGMQILFVRTTLVGDSGHEEYELTQVSSGLWDYFSSKTKPSRPHP